MKSQSVIGTVQVRMPEFSEEKDISSERYRWSPKQRTEPGLTLVELLVVLAVISVLMGILLPVMGRVRRGARTMRGMSNLREITSGVNLYAVDHGNFYPKSVATVGVSSSWNWSDPRRMTTLYHTTIGPHRAMSEYLGSYIKDADTMFCVNAPKKYKYLQAMWDAGDAWDNPDTLLAEDAANGTYCFYWNYTGRLEAGLFKGPKALCGGKGQSDLLVSDYFGFGNWRNELLYGAGNYHAYGSCEHLSGARVTPGEPAYAAGSAYWSRLDSDDFSLRTIKVMLHAGYVDGHVEGYSASEVVPMRVIMNPVTNEPYGDYGPGIFYLPPNYGD
ncbi:MAG: prepilin-type N-terminal cleavage/methylation domain-containing protein [Planctomycetota bacterium]